MFAKQDGPTALHADLVRALSFSKRQVEVDTPEGSEPAIAALASVWNGRKGFVALVLRFLEKPRVERYVYPTAITSEGEFSHATDEGLIFAESLGFPMDPKEFRGLSADLQVRRLKNWNKLRKVRKPKSSASTAKAAPEPQGPAVLGKIALERRRSSGGWSNPIERLLAFF